MPKSLLSIGIGTLSTAKKLPMYGHGDTLHCQKAPYIWALPKSPRYMGMGTVCTAEKQCTYMGTRTLCTTKKILYMGMCTLCNAKKTPVYEHAKGARAHSARTEQAQRAQCGHIAGTART